MSNHIPFEIQSEIMNMLPAKSLIRFRSVCKSWKSMIESSDFITGYSGQHQHLLVRYIECEPDYVSIIVDNDTFPRQKASVTVPPFVDMFKYYRTTGTSHGLLCLYNDRMAVIWNPSIAKEAAVVLPNVPDNQIYGTVLGFWVCGETNDPKIVKLNCIKSLWGYIPWQVEVFTLSTRAWRSPYSSILPRNSIRFSESQVVVDGVLYWLGCDRITVDATFGYYNLIISFDTTSEEFGEVNLPDSLAQFRASLSLYKLRESLVMIEHHYEANDLVYLVWIMEDGVPRTFAKLFTISCNVSIVGVRGFRKTSEPLIDFQTHPSSASIFAAYEPYSKSISNVWTDGRDSSYFVYSYVETLLLL
ncbi:putative F-box domain-containing protein [Helianthus debilis subsp. tardiflorus]